VRSAEAVAAGYFLYLVLIAPFFGAGRTARGAAAGAGLLLAGSAIFLDRLPSTFAAIVLRDWAPLLYLLLGYWLPVLLRQTPDARLEQRLLAFDTRLFAALGYERLATRTPRALLEYLELAYLLCYPLIPFALAILYFSGFAAASDRFWTTVLLAALPCYGLLPWLPMRPPRAVIDDPFASPRTLAVRSLNLFVLQRASVQANTFPSGHAAASVAASLVVLSLMPAAGTALLFVALSITVASVVGRYHYALDAILGVGLAVLAFLLVL
jgi:membrane-associated phospholipid phosphatase